MKIGFHTPLIEVLQYINTGIKYYNILVYRYVHHACTHVFSNIEYYNIAILILDQQ